ncbi:MAG: tetratricopeptide repeat protein [Mariprofundaceae bacterium]|nr:tetratricopeptide repeat protein [Mariprofundaceae bacterium]
MNRKPVVILTLLIVSTLLLGGCQSAASKMHEENQLKKARAHYDLGLDALHKNQLPKAFEELMLSDEINPNQPETLNLLAYSWYLYGDMKKSESYYKRAIHAGGGSTSHNNYGALLLELKRFDEAKKQLEKALDDPRYRNQYKARINLGDALMGLKQYDEAISVYRNADRFGSRQILSRIKEAQAYVVSDRLDDARALYESMLREERNNRTVVEGLIGVLKLQKDYPAARTRLRMFRDQSASEPDRAWAADELDKLH